MDWLSMCQLFASEHGANIDSIVMNDLDAADLAMAVAMEDAADVNVCDDGYYIKGQRILDTPRLGRGMILFVFSDKGDR